MLVVSRITSLSEWLLRQAVVWGVLAYLAFFALVVRSSPADSWVVAYFDGHFIKYATGVLFFIGLSTLVIRGLGLAVQFSLLERTRLPQASPDAEASDEAQRLLAEFDDPAAPVRETYLTRRLREALEYVRSTGSADGLESHLRHLEDVDLGRMSQDYASVRLIVAVVPILGFLGTVLGITLAIGKLDADSMKEALPAVIDGLSVAFDTTGLSLGLSMLLLLVKYFVERIELRLLNRVDGLASRTLLGRFRQYGTQSDPHVAAVRQICERMLLTIEKAHVAQARTLELSLSEVGREVAELTRESGRSLAESADHLTRQVAQSAAQLTRQAADSLERAGAAWESMAGKAGDTLQKTMVDGLTSGLQRHAAALNAGVDKHAADMQQMLVRHAEILSEGCEEYGQKLGETLQQQVDGFAVKIETMAAALEAIQNVVPAAIERHSSALATALERHTAVLTESEHELAEENRRHLSDVEAALGEAMLVAASRQEKLIQSSEDLLKEMQISLVDSAGTAVAQQEQLIKQGEVLLRVVEATGQIKRLEESLNKNLAAVTQTRDFAELIDTLSATLALLSARLGRGPAAVGAFELDLNSSASSRSQAA
jgi:biopolymer transport protein ExbB/TolQ